MITWRPALYLLASVAAGSGAVLAWRVQKHRPPTALFLTGIACDLAMAFLPAEALPLRAVAGATYPWAVLAVVQRTLAEHPRWGRASRLLPIYALYISGILAAGLHDAGLKLAYLLAQVFIVVGLGICVARWYRRPHRRPAGVSEKVAVSAAATELLNIWAYLGLPGNWHLARTSYAMLWIFSIYLHGRALLCRPSTPHTSRPPASWPWPPRSS